MTSLGARSIISDKHDCRRAGGVGLVPHSPAARALRVCLNPMFLVKNISIVSNLAHTASAGSHSINVASRRDAPAVRPDPGPPSPHSPQARGPPVRDFLAGHPSFLLGRYHVESIVSSRTLSRPGGGVSRHRCTLRPVNRNAKPLFADVETLQDDGGGRGTGR